MLNLSGYNDKKVRAFLHDGSTFEGFSTHNSFEYSFSEFGVDSECLQICDYLIREEEIERIELIEELPSVQSTEEELSMIFSVRRSFSEHLKRWEDNELPEQYDLNCFEYSAQPSKEEFGRALDLQRERGDAFIKLVGDFPLADDFGLSSGVRLTLQLAGTTDGWGVNDKVEIKTPRYKDLKETAQKHLGPLRGEDFAARNADHLYEYLDCRGAYLGEKLVGAYYFYTSDGYTCVEGLIVDQDFRQRHIAAALLKHAADEAAGNVVFLHAYQDSITKKVLEKLGFREVGRRYEYLSAEIGSFTAKRKPSG